MLAARSFALGRVALRSARAVGLQQPRTTPLLAARHFSTSGEKLANFVKLEIEEETEVQADKDSTSTTLGDSYFQIDTKGTTESYCVLKYKNATVEFAVSDLEHSEDDEVAIPFEVIIESAALKKEMIFDCIAKRADEEEAELLLESVSVKSIGSDESSYSPSFVELNEDVQESFFDYLQEHAVNTEFAETLLQIAEDKEQDLYVKWLKEVESFVKSD